MRTIALILFATLTAACSRAKDAPARTDSAATAVPVAGDTTHSNLIQLREPALGTVVTSPLTVSGQARGTWFFEASFPVLLLDANGDTLAIKPAHAEGEWMTEDFVPFSVTLEFTTAAGGTGTLVLKKDNPSGLPEHDDELRIPVRLR